MNDLLAQAIAAHGGLDRWNKFQAITTTLLGGGGMWAMKGIERDSNSREMTVMLHEERASISPFGRPDWRTAFTPERITIETTAGAVIQELVILFNNAGVASSSGETPNTIDAMAEHTAHFVQALSLAEVDVLGFSMGGYVAQIFTRQNPKLVRRLMLVGTGPRAGEPSQDSNVMPHATRPENFVSDARAHVS